MGDDMELIDVSIPAESKMLGTQELTGIASGKRVQMRILGPGSGVEVLLDEAVPEGKNWTLNTRIEISEVDA